MNEWYAAEPSVCKSAIELKYLLEKFGPFTGRYLAIYPHDWRKLVREVIKDWTELEKSRAINVLNRAYDQASIIDSPGISWNPNQSWFDNFITKLNEVASSFNGGVVELKNLVKDKPNLFTLDTLDLPPTNDERVFANPSEFVRVSKTLLLTSWELYIIDPYLNPCRNDIYSVLEEFFKVISRGRCQKIVLISRDKEALSNHTIKDIKSKLSSLRNQSKLRTNCIVEMRLVDDSISYHRMHGRFLLSIKGGVQYDQGFQKLTRDRKVDVSPIGSNRHDELLKIYHENENDMKITETIFLGY